MAPAIPLHSRRQVLDTFSLCERIANSVDFELFLFEFIMLLVEMLYIQLFPHIQIVCLIADLS